MSTPTWIDCDDYSTRVGTTGYLVETLNTNTGRTSWGLRERPLHTNQSNEPRLTGWCGETDNRSRYARGVVRVSAVNERGDRCRIASIQGADLVAFLEKDGYPELASEEFSA